MANPTPPPAQRLINCLANISPRTQSRGLKITSLALFIILLGALITSGLGFAGKLPKKLETPLIILFVALIVIFGIAAMLISCCGHYLNSNNRGNPQLQRVVSIDSGLESSSSSLLNSPNRSLDNLHNSQDSGINI